MTPYAWQTRHSSRRTTATIIAPLVLLIAALAVLVATLSVSGVQIPGAHRVSAVLNRIPQPWKPPRPAHVLSPDVQIPALALSDSAGAGGTAVGAGSQAVTGGQGSSNSASGQPADGSPAVAAAPVREESEAAEAEAEAVAAEAEGPPAVVTRPVHPAATAPIPASFRLDGFRHQWQGWNNCGPATITMATSYFGRTETQNQAAAFLKPNPNDKNVNPDEMVAFVRTLGLHSDWLVAGDIDRVKRLVSNGVPVVVEVWLEPDPNDGMGHYRLVVGYDDAARQFIIYDSYDQPGINVRMTYAKFDEDWRVFNRTYLPIYTAEKAEVVGAITGYDGENAMQMYRRSLSMAQDEAGAWPNDAFAWFNMGTSLTRLGRTAEAVQAFDRARTLRLPWRMLWYQFAPFEAYLAEGRLSDVLALTNANLAQASDLEESQYYRGKALEVQGQVAQARAAYQAAIRANPKYAPASHALSLLG